MAPHIGSAQFNDPLRWHDPEAPTVVGSDTRTRSGDMVSIRVSSPSQKARTAKLTYSYEPYSTYLKLLAMARSGGTYSADFEGDGTSRTVRLAAQNGVGQPKNVGLREKVVHASVRGYATDRYEGEINVIIVS